MRLSLYLSLMVLLAMTPSCQRAMNPSAPAGSEAPVPTAVGPVPGNTAPAHQRRNPYAGDPVALQDGQRLFNWYNCSGCHGGHAGGGMGPSLRDETWIYGNRDDQIFDTILQGRANGMPSWGTKIPEAQIWQLVVYVKSLGTAQEPDPPIVPSDEVVGPDFKSPVKMDAPLPE